MKKTQLFCLLMLVYSQVSAAKKEIRPVEIKCHGLYCYSFKDNNDRVVVTDIFDPQHVKIPVPDIKPNILVITHNALKKSYFEIIDEPFQIVKSQGRYRIMGIEFDGTNVDGNVIYSWKLDGLKFVFLGDLREFTLNDLTVKKYEEADILFFPVNDYSASQKAKSWLLIGRLNPIKVIFTGINQSAGSKIKNDDLLKQILGDNMERVVFAEDGVYPAVKQARKIYPELIVLPLYTAEKDTQESEGGK